MLGTFRVGRFGKMGAGCGTGLGFVFPPEQSLLINGVANSIKISRPASITADGAGIGAAAGSPPTLLYTPGALDDAQALAIVGTTTTRNVMVVAANGPQTITGGGCSYTGGRPDFDGGTTGIDIIPAAGTARRLIDLGITGRPTSANSGIEFKVSDPMNASLDGFSLYQKLNFRFVNGVWQTGSIGDAVGTAYPVERKQTSDGIWTTRWWLRLEAGKVNDTAWMDLTNAWNNTVNVAAATAAFRFSGFRYIDGIMNMPTWQRISVRDHVVAVDGGTDDLVKSRPNTRKMIWLGPPFDDGTNSAQYGVEVMVPSTFDVNRSSKYDAILLPKVEAAQNTYNGEIASNGSGSSATWVNQGFSYNQALIDALDVVLVSPETSRQSWGGKNSAGQFDHGTLLGKALPVRLERMLNLNGRWGGIGWSKGLFVIIYLMQTYPERFKAGAVMDGPATRDYAWLTTVPHNYLDYPGAGSEFDNQAAFDAFDPFANFAARKAPFLGSKKLSVMTGDTFATEMGLLKTLLDAQGVTYVDRGNLVPGRQHDYYKVWGEQALNDVVGLMRGTIS